jgi:endonuclease III
LTAAEKVLALTEHALKVCKRTTYTVETYPKDVLTIVLFHRIHLSMPWEKALKAYQALQHEFVDWNEIRVSSLRELQEHLRGADNQLELAVFIKDFLEHVQRERHNLCLESLVEENLTDVRRFFRSVRGIEAATVDLVLNLRKGHPVFPLTQAMETVLVKLGICQKTATRDQRQKRLFTLVEPPEAALTLHHFLVDLGRELDLEGPVDKLAIPSLPSNNLATFFRQLVAKSKKKASSSKKSASSAKSTAKKAPVG